MNLYHLTLQPPTAINCIAAGSFTAPDVYEILVSHERYLDLVRVDESGIPRTILSSNVFGIVRCMKTVRVIGMEFFFVK
jgi:splicing factor 3B subunit 3